MALSWRKSSGRQSRPPERIGPVWSPAIFLIVVAPWIIVFVSGGFSYSDQSGDPSVLLLAWVIFLIGISVWVVDVGLRALISNNLKRIASYYRAHETAPLASQPVALVLRSFGQVHGYLDKASGFSALWLLDDALTKTGFRPVMLGAPTSLPPDYSVLFLPSSDSDWQEMFEHYAEAAATILPVPESTDSLVTEVTVLRQNQWLAKTVIVMTPASIPRKAVSRETDWYLGGDDATRQRRWATATSQFHELGIRLPKYDPGGALIELDAKGKPLRVSRLGLDGMSMERRKRRTGLFSPSPAPDEVERFDCFLEAWSTLIARRRFTGPALSQVYPTTHHNLPRYGWSDLLHPPGNDGILRFNLRGFLVLGWGLPSLAYLMKTFF